MSVIALLIESEGPCVDLSTLNIVVYSIINPLFLRIFKVINCVAVFSLFSLTFLSFFLIYHLEERSSRGIGESSE